MPRGRYCAKSSDGWWLLVRGGSSWYITDPAPPEPATSFFGKSDAAAAIRREGLPYLDDLLKEHKVDNYDALRASGFTGAVWAAVPDPNP